MKKIIALLWAASVSLLFAQDIEITDKEKLLANLDKEVSVVGIPNEKSNVAKSGHHFLNFDDSEFVVFCFRAVANGLPEGKKPIDFKGKKIRITGKLALYKNKPQIVIRKDGQITVIEEKPEVKEEKQEEEKQEEKEDKDTAGKKEKKED